MSLLAIGLQPQVAFGLFGITGRLGRTSIADLLISRTAAYSMMFDATAQTIDFDFRTSTDVLSSIASDCNRLSSSCFQSLFGIENDIQDREKFPWCIIRLYYSAFYAGHFILRSLGQSCSFLDARHVSRVAQFASIVGSPIPFKFETGLYNLEIHSRSTKFSCVKLPSQNSHDAFWSLLAQRWQSTAQNVLIGPLVASESQRVFAQLDAFDQLMRRHRNYGWLSTLRNDVQYRHKFDVWYPCGITKRDREGFGRIIEQWKSDPMDINVTPTRMGTLGDFALCCSFIISVCRSIILRIVELEPLANRSFARFGPLTYLNSADVAAR